MRFASIFGAVVALSIGCALAEIKTDEGVLVLTKENFKDATTDHEFILVEFYAPWCGHCKALAPEYAKAAQALADKGSDIKLGKVDATEEGELAEEYGVRGYPTLKFFRGGKPVEYGGGRQADDIVNWLLKKTGPPAKELKTVDEAKEFIDLTPVSIVGFFKDQSSDKAKAFLAAAALIDDQPFAITSEEALYKEYEAECGDIILFKKFDEGKAKFEGEYNDVDIKAFVATNSLPLIVEFNHDTAQKIFGGEIKSHLLIFIDRSKDHFETISEAARSIAKPFKDQVLFVTIDASEDDHQRILEFFGMKKEEVPAVRLIRLEDDMAKYKPESSELTADALKKFVTDFIEGKLKQHLLSQELPEDWNATPVKTLVASNFDEIALDATKDVLVEFYAPWCGHCKQLAPIYDKVGEHFESNDDIIVAKMDATANELEHTKVTSFPTLKLYAKGENKIIEYNGARTFEAMTKFLETGGVDQSDDDAAAGGADVEDEDGAQAKDEL